MSRAKERHAYSLDAARYLTRAEGNTTRANNYNRLVAE